MRASFYRYMLAAFAAGTLAASGAALAQVDVAKSAIVATSKQMNVPVDGKFTKFTAQVTFDPAKPASGSAKFTVDVSSYDLGDKEYNDQVAGKDWFDAKTYPTATFVANAIKPAGGNKYNVTGLLTIKGTTQSVTVPVTVTQQGADQIFEGALPIKRSTFNIGTGEWKDTSVVSDDIIIKFHIVAAKQG
jgi:polyisoprenoid-binding protein YceI